MNTTNDQLQEKKINLENELRRVQIELVEVLNLNDNLTLENKEKVYCLIINMFVMRALG